MASLSLMCTQLMTLDRFIAAGRRPQGQTALKERHRAASHRAPVPGPQRRPLSAIASTESAHATAARATDPSAFPNPTGSSRPLGEAPSYWTWRCVSARRPSGEVRGNAVAESGPPVRSGRRSQQPMQPRPIERKRDDGSSHKLPTLRTKYTLSIRLDLASPPSHTASIIDTFKDQFKEKTPISLTVRAEPRPPRWDTDSGYAG